VEELLNLPSESKDGSYLLSSEISSISDNPVEFAVVSEANQDHRVFHAMARVTYYDLGVEEDSTTFFKRKFFDNLFFCVIFDPHDKVFALIDELIEKLMIL